MSVEAYEALAFLNSSSAPAINSGKFMAFDERQSNPASPAKIELVDILV